MQGFNDMAMFKILRQDSSFWFRAQKILWKFFATLSVLVLLATSQAAAFTPEDFSCANQGGTGGTCFYNPDTCTTTSSTSTAADGGSTYILGDSITAKAADAYTKLFSAVSIDGSSSRTLSSPGIDGNKLSGMDAIKQDSSQISSASTIVIALGTNGGDTKSSIDSAIQALKAINSTAPIYWVDTFVLDRPTYNQSVIAKANKAIYDEASSQNYNVISWAKTVDPDINPQYPTGNEKDTNSYIDNSDGLGVHPTASGATALANLVSTTVGNGSAASATPAAGGTPPSTLVMQKVDLSGFHPDPQAIDYFKKTSLPLLKKYIPLYVQAAQAEGAPQNWELLAAIHGPELAYGNYFQSNGAGSFPAGGPSGPFQETMHELTPYLSDPAYGPVLKTLVTPAGVTIPHSHVSDAQFVILGRLAFKHWFSDALGSDYSKLKSGPIPFNPAVDSSNPLYKIESTWNGVSSTGLAEGFNGYNTGAQAYSTSISVWPGIATTYYLLKQREASGGMSTINVPGAAASNCGSSATSATGTNCESAVGDAKILCEAKQYSGIWYVWGGGHESYSTFQAACPDPLNPPNNQPTGGPGAARGDPGGNTGNPSPCAVDCSGLVSVAADQAFGINVQWDVGSLEADATNWKQIDISTVQAGDVVVRDASHVEIVDNYDSSGGKLHTFGAFAANVKTGTDTSSLSDWTGAYHYVGKGT